MRFFKKIFVTTPLFILALLCSLRVFSQTTTQNYVLKMVPNREITTDTKLTSLSANKDSVQTTIQYLDGLGRPLQTVMQKGSPLGNDIIQPFSYDAKGRQDKQYLPYVNTSTSYGTYRSDALTSSTGEQAFYNPSGGNTESNRVGGVVITPAFFGQTVYEASPLNRVLEQGAPGLAWQTSATPDADHTLRVSFTSNEQTSTFNTGNISSTNAGSRKAAWYKATINANGSRSLTRTGNNATYSPGLLTVKITKDANWKTTNGCFGTVEEYSDKEGHLVLKRSYNINGTVAEMLSTYYVYDDLGNLVFVLPPGIDPDATAAILQSNLDIKAYQYRYDARNRLTQKKIPGKGWEYSIYNKLNQVVATQDSVQRMKSTQEWSIVKYDAIGRVTLTGIYQYGTTAGVDNHVTVQSAVDGVVTYWESPITTGSGYTNNAWPTTLSSTLKINYYDTYVGIPNLPAVYDLHTNAAYSKETTGFLTATKTLVLNTTADYLWTVPYYNDKGQIVKTLIQHYLGGASSLSPYNYDDMTTGYTFIGQPETIIRLHYASNAGTSAVLKLIISDGYTYDHMGRQLSLKDTLKDGTNSAQTPVTLSKNTYNEVGQRIKKGLHSLNGTTFLQNVDYRYNARGWLTNINNPTLSNDAGVTSSDAAGNDQFGMELKYDGAANAQYNENIGSTKTITGALSGTSYPALTYNYSYDKQNRLVNEVSTTSTTNDNFYNENVTYDVMGNIQKLNRYDKSGGTRVAVDSLSYTYIGYRQDRIDDAVSTATGFIDAVKQAGEYTYDGNGNELKDLNKGLSSISYNMINLPQTIVKSDGSTLAYVYDATGRKLRKLFTNGSIVTTTEYIGGVQYEYTGSTPTIAFVVTTEGRARKSGTVYKYEYDLKDQLGNTRVTTTWNASDATQMTPVNSQRSDYYAFGYAIQSMNGTVPSPKNEYLYNGKELQEETGLYDYGARLYDPVIGRWNSVDPLAEISRRWSPYNYVYNNPINLIDPDGMAADDANEHYSGILAQAFFRGMQLAWDEQNEFHQTDGVDYDHKSSGGGPHGGPDDDGNQGRDGQSQQQLSSNGELNLTSLLGFYSGNGEGGKADYILSKSEFDKFVSTMRKYGRIDTKEGKPVPSVKGLYQVQVSAYGTPYENPVGTGTLYYNSTGIVGYSDYWDFDHKSSGKRPLWGEVKTWIGSAIPGSAFFVLYGIRPTDYNISH